MAADGTKSLRTAIFGDIVAKQGEMERNGRCWMVPEEDCWRREWGRNNTEFSY